MAQKRGRIDDIIEQFLTEKSRYEHRPPFMPLPLPLPFITTATAELYQQDIDSDAEEDEPMKKKPKIESIRPVLRRSLKPTRLTNQEWSMIRLYLSPNMIKRICETQQNLYTETGEYPAGILLYSTDLVYQFANPDHIDRDISQMRKFHSFEVGGVVSPQEPLQEPIRFLLSYDANKKQYGLILNEGHHRLLYFSNVLGIHVIPATVDVGHWDTDYSYRKINSLQTKIDRYGYLSIQSMKQLGLPFVIVPC